MHQVLPQTVSSVLQYLFEHLFSLATPAVIWAAIKFGRFIGKAETRVLTAEGHIVKMATNDMPHMGAALQEIKSSNASAASSLAILVERTPKRASKAKASR